MTITRTPTRATGGITDAERDAMAVIAREWIGIAMRTDPIEPDKIVPAIKRLYAAANLPAPRVVIVPSPRVMAAAYGAAAAIWHSRKAAATYAATYAATDDATRAATRAATDAATYDATSAATRAATDDSMLVCLQIAGAFGVACARNWGRSYQGGNMWAAFPAYAAAMRDVLDLRLPNFEKYQAWEDCARHGGFRVIHPEFCIVSDFPEILRVDDRNRPHSETGPSHRWRDGWELYHWHGVKIPGEWITDKAALTPQIALTWENIEQRRAAMEIIGWARILRELKAKVIHDSSDPETGTLVEVDLPGNEIQRAVKARFLHVLCGTKREFALGVPPDTKTAEAAQAWLFGETAYTKPEIRT